jgi:LmbE family N-acetylglucosaminyl deacetylase
MLSRRRFVSAFSGLFVAGVLGSSDKSFAVSKNALIKKSKKANKKIAHLDEYMPSTLNPSVLTSPSKQAVFYSPHPDDEVLSFGPIASELYALGHELIFVLLTGGSTTVAIKLINGELSSPGNGTRFAFKGMRDPNNSGYALLTQADVGKARTIEFKSAAAELGVKKGNAFTFDLLVENDIPLASATTVIEQMVARYPDATHWGMSTVDTHPHHRTAGEALRIVADKTHVRSAYVISRPTLKQITEQIKANNVDVPIPTPIKPDSSRMQKVRNAMLPYNAWNPAANSFAIGYSSVPNQFEELDVLGSAQYSLIAPPLEKVVNWIVSSHI